MWLGYAWQPCEWVINDAFPFLAVVMSELVKLFTCLLIVFKEEDSSLGKVKIAIHEQIIRQPMDTLKVCIPSLIYVVQNNLLYLAASNLDAATYQVWFFLYLFLFILYCHLFIKALINQSKAFKIIIISFSFTINGNDLNQLCLNSLDIIRCKFIMDCVPNLVASIEGGGGIFISASFFWFPDSFRKNVSFFGWGGGDIFCIETASFCILLKKCPFLIFSGLFPLTKTLFSYHLAKNQWAASETKYHRRLSWKNTNGLSIQISLRQQKD